MILTQIRLHNFGVYAGQHSIPLEPPDQNRPIVLFGGLNGAGKTTILEAILLSLYGKRTPTVKREGLSYEDYLLRCIHQGVPRGDGAAVELCFRIRSEGDAQSIRIARNWYQTKSGVRERVRAYKALGQANEKYDAFLSEQWDEYIDEIVPLGVAPLFFFDADRIEGFADLANSGDLIRTAVHGLLGLDLVDRLSLDLEVVERRKTAETSPTDSRSELLSANEAVETAKTSVQRSRERVQGVESERDEIAARLAEVEERLRREGGDLFEQRGALELSLRHTKGTLADAEESLRSKAAGAAPLLLVKELLSELHTEDRRDQEREASEVIRSRLERRDAALVHHLLHLGANGGLVSSVREFLEDDRATLSTGDSDPVFGLSRDVRHALSQLVNEGLDELRDQIEAKLKEAEMTQLEVDQLERRLLAVPDRDSVAALLEERGGLRSRLSQKERDLARLREELARDERILEGAERSRASVQKRAAARAWEDEGARRTIEFSGRSRSLLAEFRQRILQKNVTRIEQFVLESFRQLVRKEGLVQSLEIDPESLSLRLFGREGQSIHADRLSAGERQLLAVSLLWGLARASYRALPTIVDTPLGRLDSVHREHLVERYFPNASHQVILLSTDEEINEVHLERIEEHVGRSFSLNYDDMSGMTQIVDGYFALEVAS